MDLGLWTPEPIRTSQEEINMVEWPWAVLTDASPRNRRVLEFADTIRAADGKSLQRKWTVTAPANGSLPTAFDEGVYLALAEITKERGCVSDMVPFTKRDLVRRLGMGKFGGKEYARIESALRRLEGVNIEAVNAFYDKNGRVYRSLSFHILDELALGDGRSESEDNPTSYARWGRVLFTSMQARYLKSVDLDFFLQIASPLARRMYRFLDRKRWNNDAFSVALRKLAWEHMGLSRSYGNPELRRLVGRAADELTARGFLLGHEFGTTVHNEPKITFAFAQRGGRALPPPETPAKALPPALGPPAAIVAAETARLEALDAKVTPEILEAAAELVESRPRPPKRGGKVWTGMVRDAAREIAAGG